jgi:hypothetical protein
VTYVISMEESFRGQAKVDDGCGRETQGKEAQLQVTVVAMDGIRTGGLPSAARDFCRCIPVPLARA